MTNQEKLAKLFEILAEVEAYGRAVGKMSFDMECCAPEEGLEQAGEDMAILGKHIHELTHSEEYIQLVCGLNADSEGLAPLEKKLVERLFESYEKTKNLSAEFSYEMDVVFNKAYGAWLKAKKEDDFSAFAQNLGDVVAYTRKAIDLRDRKYESYYKACLDDNEKGSDESQLDAFFAAVNASGKSSRKESDTAAAYPENFLSDILSEKINSICHSLDAVSLGVINTCIIFGFICVELEAVNDCASAC